MIKPKKELRYLEIDLTGPDGNAFHLLGYAKKLCRELGFETSETMKVMEELKSGDYEHLVETFDKYFGSFVILYR